MWPACPAKMCSISAKALSLVDPKTGLGVTTGRCTSTWPPSRSVSGKWFNSLVDVHLANFKASGTELVMGEAKFTDRKPCKSR